MANELLSFIACILWATFSQVLGTTYAPTHYVLPGANQIFECTVDGTDCQSVISFAMVYANGIQTSSWSALGATVARVAQWNSNVAYVFTFAVDSSPTIDYVVSCTIPVMAGSCSSPGTLTRTTDGELTGPVAAYVEPSTLAITTFVASTSGVYRCQSGTCTQIMLSGKAVYGIALSTTATGAVSSVYASTYSSNDAEIWVATADDFSDESCFAGCNGKGVRAGAFYSPWGITVDTEVDKNMSVLVVDKTTQLVKRDYGIVDGVENAKVEFGVSMSWGTSLNQLRNPADVKIEKDEDGYATAYAIWDQGNDRILRCSTDFVCTAISVSGITGSSFGVVYESATTTTSTTTTSTTGSTTSTTSLSTTTSTSSSTTTSTATSTTSSTTSTTASTTSTTTSTITSSTSTTTTISTVTLTITSSTSTTSTRTSSTTSSATSTVTSTTSTTSTHTSSTTSTSIVTVSSTTSTSTSTTTSTFTISSSTSSTRSSTATSTSTLTSITATTSTPISSTTTSSTTTVAHSSLPPSALTKDSSSALSTSMSPTSATTTTTTTAANETTVTETTTRRDDNRTTSTTTSSMKTSSTMTRAASSSAVTATSTATKTLKEFNLTEFSGTAETVWEAENAIVSSVSDTLLQEALAGELVTFEVPSGNTAVLCGLNYDNCSSTEVDAMGVWPLDFAGISTTLWPNNSVVMLVSTIEDEYAPALLEPSVEGLSSLMRQYEAATVKAASSAVTVTLLLDNGEVANVQDLDSPFSIGLPRHPGVDEGDEEEGQLRCVYWSESRQQWATDGVSLVLNDHGLAEADGDHYWCKSTHLSVFAVLRFRGLFETLACTNLKIFGGDAIEALFSSSNGWQGSDVAIMYYLLVVFLTGILVIAIRVDRKRRDLWSDEYYFRGGDDSTSSFDPSSSNPIRESQMQMGSINRPSCGVQSSSMRPRGTSSWQTSTLSDAGQILGFFRLFRRPEWLQGASLTKENLERAGVDALIDHCLHADVALEHWIGATTLDQSGLTNKGSENWALTSTMSGMSSNFVELHHRVVQRLPGLSRRLQQARMLALVPKLFIFWHPVFNVMCLDVQMSASRKAIALVNSLLGSILVTVLFFQSTGAALSAESSPACQEPFNPTRFILMGLFGTFLATLPVFVSMKFAERKFWEAEGWDLARRQRHLRRWYLLSYIMWTWDAAFALFCIFSSLSFLANLHRDDYGKWRIAFVSIVLRWVFLMPLFYALAVVLLVRGVSWSRPETFRKNLDYWAMLESDNNPCKSLDVSNSSVLAQTPSQNMSNMLTSMETPRGCRAVSVLEVFDFWVHLPYWITRAAGPDAAELERRVEKEGVHAVMASLSVAQVMRSILLPLSTRRLGPLTIEIAKVIGRAKLLHPIGRDREYQISFKILGRLHSDVRQSIQLDKDLREPIVVELPLPEEGEELKITILASLGRSTTALAWAIVPASEFWGSGSEVKGLRLEGHKGPLDASLQFRGTVAHCLPGLDVTHPYFVKSVESGLHMEVQSHDARLVLRNREPAKEQWEGIDLIGEETTTQIDTAYGGEETTTEIDTAYGGFAFSTIMASFKTRQPNRILAHTLDLSFRELVAAILSDSMGEAVYGCALSLLMGSKVGLEDVRTRLQKLEGTAWYWIPCFCENLHDCLAPTLGGHWHLPEFQSFDLAGFERRYCEFNMEVEPSEVKALIILDDDCSLVKANWPNLLRHLHAHGIPLSIIMRSHGTLATLMGILIEQEAEGGRKVGKIQSIDDFVDNIDDDDDDDDNVEDDNNEHGQVGELAFLEDNYKKSVRNSLRSCLENLDLGARSQDARGQIGHGPSEMLSIAALLLSAELGTSTLASIAQDDVFLQSTYNAKL